MNDTVTTPAGLIVPRKAVDGLVNVVSGLGTNKSKGAHNQFVLDALNNYQQLDAAYQTNWIARRIVDTPAEDMTREWRSIKTKDTESIELEEDRLSLKQNVSDAVSWARLYGGSGILMITNQDLGKPLEINKIKKGDLKRLLVLDRYDMTPLTINYNDILAENYLLPNFYSVQGGAQSIHWTHFARFQGAKLPRRQMQRTVGWGDSELRICMQDIMETVAAKGGLAELLQELNLDVITREGLAEDLASDQDDAITDRYTLFSQLKSIFNMALLDGAEKYERKTLNLSGTPQSLEVLMIWIAGCAKMPYTKLWGVSPTGLNATGQGDADNYNDTIRSAQNSQIARPLYHIDQVMVRSAIGDFPDSFDYTWNPLSTPDIVENAQAGLLNAQKDAVYLENQVVEVSQIQKNLRSNEEYQFDENQIEESENSENDNPFEFNENGENSDPSESLESEIDPSKSLNGAQVTALLSIIAQISTGEISKATGEKIIASSFPVSESEAKSLLSDVKEGDRKEESSE